VRACVRVCMRSDIFIFILYSPSVLFISQSLSLFLSLSLSLSLSHTHTLSLSLSLSLPHVPYSPTAVYRREDVERSESSKLTGHARRDRAVSRFSDRGHSGFEYASG